MALQTGIFGDLLSEQRELISSEIERARIEGEVRSSLENPQTPLSYPAEWLLDIFNGGRTDSGVRVSELTAFQSVYFLACVDFIAGAVASTPIHVYERKILGNGRASHIIAYDHDLYELVHLEPNPEMSRYVFLKTFMAHVLAWNGGYAEIQRDAANQAVAFWPRNPYKTRPYRLHADIRLDPVPWRPFPVKLTAGTLVYRTTDGIDATDETDTDAERPGSSRFIPAEDMIHLPGLSFDGRIGQSVVWLARQTIGLALATEKFSAKYFANFAKPSGLLIAPGAITGEQKEQSKRSWMEAQGGENANRVATMFGGWDFKPISNKPDESQLNETELTLAQKITAFFHVPPHVVGLSQKSGRSNMEQEAQEITQYTLSPWFSGLRMEFKRKLFPSPGVGRVPRSPFYVDFDLTELLRPDAASRNNYYNSGKQWGYLNTNDVRAYEKLNPIEEPWAEDYWMPINMTLAYTPLDPNNQDGAGNGEKPPKEDDDEGGKSDADPDEKGKASARYFRHYSPLFLDAFGRILAREKRDLKAIRNVFGPVLFSLRDAWFDLVSIGMNLEECPGQDSDAFIADYLNSLQTRAQLWNPAERDEVGARELHRAIEAMRITATREANRLQSKPKELSNAAAD